MRAYDEICKLRDREIKQQLSTITGKSITILGAEHCKMEGAYGLLKEDKSNISNIFIYPNIQNTLSKIMDQGDESEVLFEEWLNRNSENLTSEELANMENIKSYLTPKSDCISTISEDDLKSAQKLFSTVAETEYPVFDAKILNPKHFIAENFDYIVFPKSMEENQNP